MVWIRGHIKYELLQQLAEGTKTQEELAEEYDVSFQTISYHAVQNREKIAAMRANAEDKLAGLWIANKEARLAEYEADADYVNKAIEAHTDSTTGTPSDFLFPILPTLLRTKQNALRAAADEMGQIPAKLQITVQPVQVDYTINGVDMGKV